MLRTFDFLMIGAMLAAATVTYQIKHNTDNKAAEVRRLEAEIKLEKDTIDLLKADKALLTQPNRLERLVQAYAAELQLVPTEPSQLARPMELPMLKDQLPVPEGEEGPVSAEAPSDPIKDLITTGSVDR
ncbi:cell division protein FtsL [Allorhizobium sp. NPDC080224]|uniref:Cell division protein FtsL n=2 Tax=Rhizobium/Agrobacterium group TaxID=227290 RepID=K2PEX2_9HYPH|nr:MULTISPECIES: hypothetical protein [Rhizobium/Agrobacterium group]EKF59488.1 hypothetical protein QWE_09707 [Agrobacterium albertimagni AOL15]QRF53440.1 hypothetical protein D4A92_19310 [Rhizobium rosettiformans]